MKKEQNINNRRNDWGNQEKIKLEPDTKIEDLFKNYPRLKKHLIQSNTKFELLKSPVAKFVVPNVTLKMVSKTSKVPYEELVEIIGDFIVDNTDKK